MQRTGIHEPAGLNEEMSITIAANLQDILLAPDVQPEVTADCLQLIDQEVSDKSGVSGAGSPRLLWRPLLAEHD